MIIFVLFECPHNHVILTLQVIRPTLNPMSNYYRLPDVLVAKGVVEKVKGPVWKIVMNINVENTVFLLYGVRLSDCEYVQHTDFINQSVLSEIFQALEKANHDYANQFIEIIHTDTQITPDSMVVEREFDRIVKSIAKSNKYMPSPIIGKCFGCLRCKKNDRFPFAGSSYLKNILMTGLCAECQYHKDCQEP